MPRYSRNVRSTALLITLALYMLAGACYVAWWFGYRICVIGHNTGLVIGQGLSRNAKRLPTGQVISQRLSYFSETVGLGILAVLLHLRSGILQFDRQIVKLTGDDVFMAWFCRCLVLIILIVIGGGFVYTIRVITK